MRIGPANLVHWTVIPWRAILRQRTPRREYVGSHRLSLHMIRNIVRIRISVRLDRRFTEKELPFREE